jgi:hypothetical protein
MHFVMVMNAEQIEVFWVGFTAVDPVNPMMSFSERRWPITAGPGATTVTDGKEMP